MLAGVLDEALRVYGAETTRLRFLPENRYNRRLFPAQGQYDWFSGQALYCLVRHLRPRQVVEISCANGYSSLFMALGLQENGAGRLETFELSRRNARRAEENFRRFGVEPWVRVHVGDARRTIQEIALEQTDLLFLDSLHTEAFARWYLGALVPRLAPRVPVHVHDILPRHARVRHFDGPPFAGGWTVSWLYRAAVRLLRPGQFEHTRIPASAVHAHNGRLTYDGNHFAEGRYLNRLAERLAADDYAYLYDLADRYPELGPREFDRQAVGRKNAFDQPMEWNESLWCYAGPLAAAYAAAQAGASVPALAAPLERRA